MKKTLLLSLVLTSFLLGDKIYLCKLTHINEMVPLTERQLLSMGETAKLSLSYDKINAKAKIVDQEINLKYFDTDSFGYDLYVTEEQTDIIGISSPEGKKGLPGVFLQNWTPNGNVKLWYRCK
jgi:hypothetical protein